MFGSRDGQQPDRTYSDSPERARHDAGRPELLRAIFESAADGILVIDDHGIIESCNPAAERMFGYSSGELNGCELSVLMPSDSEGKTSELVARYQAGEGRLIGSTREIVAQKKDGSPVSVELTVSEVRLGSERKFTGFVRDITQRHFFETSLLEYAKQVDEHRRQILDQAEALRKARDVAESTARMKSEFLANMSHEIRTPLTSILGYAETMLHEGLSPSEQARALEVMLRNGNHLLAVLNDILDFSKIEAGKLEVELVETSPLYLLEETLGMMRVKAQEKGLAVDVSYRFPLPSLIQTDPTRLKQVLMNLIGNAIKFTDTGGVRIEMKFVPEEQELSFSITDTGCGMTEEQLGRIGRPFSQADPGHSRRYGGTGLGLAISKHLTEQLNGEVRVSSRLGHGSCFVLSLKTGPIAKDRLLDTGPRSETPRRFVQRNQVPRLAGRVLLVEDGPDNRELISMLLRRVGVDVTTAENGLEAVEICGKESFDLILMDMQMPVMDGYAAARSLRNSGLGTPIVALTANSVRQSLDECRESGCTDFLTKPFRRDQFFELLKRYLEVNGVSRREMPEDIRLDPSYGEVVQTFISVLREHLPKLSTASIDSDGVEVKRIAHRLATSGLFGFPELGEMARRLQNLRLPEQAGTASILVGKVVAEARRILDQYPETVVAQDSSELASGGRSEDEPSTET